MPHHEVIVPHDEVLALNLTAVSQISPLNP